MEVETRRNPGVHWFSGKIAAVDLSTHKYTIQYDDGLVGLVKHERIRKLRSGVKKTVAKQRRKRGGTRYRASRPACLHAPICVVC